MKIDEIMQNNAKIPSLEKKIEQFWKVNTIFEKSVQKSSNPQYVFYDGPPFANGLPHYGHLLTGYIKDTFGRYHTMLNKRVSRRFGWDCHGLPAEMGAEKELQISGRKMITEFGIDKFNAHCKKSVLQYTAEWEEYVSRQGRWVDFHDDYKTMDIQYMESVIWAFKTLYDKGLIYQSERVMPYSWACETPVSDFETKIDNSYREKASKSATIAFTISQPSAALISALSDHRCENIQLLVWTTTPWTLPSNLALAVGKNIEYRCFLQNNKCYIIAKELANNYQKELSQNEHYIDIQGHDIIGSRYAPLFSYFQDHTNGFNILDADFVSTEDGTGIVHIAPGFGEEDYELCKKHNIDIVCPVDDSGKFTDLVQDFAGMQVFDANDPILSALKEKNAVIRIEQYLHNYPHCWRTDKPLIYKAVPSWHLKVTSIKEDMIRNNEQINWIPGHIKHGLFKKWLENARDWSISRNRFWGCPIPVWQSDDPRYPHTEVYGSIAELEAAFNTKITDLHRPYIDNLTKPNPSDPTGQSKLVRVQEVFDCWFESGSMPFAHVHYPFENKEWFENNFPADFIAEYVAQTRGWFYTLMVLSTALFNKTPFLNCICHGVILGDGKTKLSKRLKNYADPREVFDTIGADPMRWYMLSSNVMRGQEIVIDKEASGMSEAARNVVQPLLNAANFFAMYAAIDNAQPEINFAPADTLNKYIISRSLLSFHKVRKYMDAYDTVSACDEIRLFIEILNNWYIRRSREKFWSSDSNDAKHEAYNTLFTVLTTITKLAAPLLPFTTEHIYKILHKNSLSVHVENLSIPNIEIDHQLISDMERVREACTTALSLRNDAKIRIRQPLSEVTFIGVAEHKMNDAMLQLVLSETNVKTWNNLPSSKISEYADCHLKLKLETLGKRIPHMIKNLISASKKGNWQKIDEKSIKIADTIIYEGEFIITLTPKSQYEHNTRALPSNDGLVMLNMNIDKPLLLEGHARDFIRFVQQKRKDMQLAVTDRITLSVNCPDAQIAEALNKHKDYILDTTLADNIDMLSQTKDTEIIIDGISVHLSISPISA